MSTFSTYTPACEKFFRLRRREKIPYGAPGAPRVLPAERFAFGVESAEEEEG